MRWFAAIPIPVIDSLPPHLDQCTFPVVRELALANSDDLAYLGNSFVWVPPSEQYQEVPFENASACAGKRARVEEKARLISCGARPSAASN